MLLLITILFILASGSANSATIIMFGDRLTVDIGFDEYNPTSVQVTNTHNYVPTRIFYSFITTITVSDSQSAISPIIFSNNASTLIPSESDDFVGILFNLNSTAYSLANIMLFAGNAHVIKGATLYQLYSLNGYGTTGINGARTFGPKPLIFDGPGLSISDPIRRIEVQFDNVAAIPLPAALPLLAGGIGLLGLLGWRSRSRQVQGAGTRPNS
jgi:hypothetical protein